MTSSDFLTPDQAMQMAYEESLKGWGNVNPNPMVGCVITDPNGKLISKGFHAKYGEAHAEVIALNGMAQEDIKNAIVYVTLEPCSHEGKTPSCAKMLAKLPIKKVVYSVNDPNPLVMGQGIKILKDAGIETQFLSTFENKCKRSSEIHIYNMIHNKPFIAVKAAITFDGYMSSKKGKYDWITGVESRSYTHYLRAGYDAILVGKKTVLIDNPQLNVRHPSFENKENKVIVIDPELSLMGKSDLNFLKFHNPRNIHMVHKVGKKTPDLPFNFIGVEFNNDGLLNINNLLSRLYDLGIKSIFIEGGPYTQKHFLNNKLVQRIYLFKSSKTFFDQEKTADLRFPMEYVNQMRSIESKILIEDEFITGTIEN